MAGVPVILEADFIDLFCWLMLALLWSDMRSYICWSICFRNTLVVKLLLLPWLKSLLLSRSMEWAGCSLKY